MKYYFISTLLFFSFLMQGQSYVLDSSFGSNGAISTNHDISPVNGYFEGNKYYLFGNGTRIARYNYDGSADASFGNYGFFVFSIAGEYTALQNFKIYDGQCYAFGKTSLATTTSLPDGLIIRLTTSGQLDPSFGVNGIVKLDLGADESFNDIMITPDGAIYAIGTKQNNYNDGRVLVCKFHADGTLDTSFNGTGSKVFPYSQYTRGISIFTYGNGILLGNSTNGTSATADIYLQKIDTAGNPMPDFGTNGELRIPIQVYGSSTAFRGLKLVGNKIYCHYYWGVSFSSQGYGLRVYDITNPSNAPWSVGMSADSYFQPFESGKLLVTSGLSLFPGTSSTHYTVRQYNADGTYDTTFDNDGVYEYDFSTFYNTAEGATFAYLHDDGKVFLAGSYTKLAMLRIGNPALANENPDADAGLFVYPNPSSEILYIHNKSNALLENVFINDVSGKKIQPSINTENGVDISALSKGIYFLSFTADGNYHTIRFVKS